MAPAPSIARTAALQSFFLSDPLIYHDEEREDEGGTEEELGAPPPSTSSHKKLKKGQQQQTQQEKEEEEGFGARTRTRRRRNGSRSSSSSSSSSSSNDGGAVVLVKASTPMRQGDFKGKEGGGRGAAMHVQEHDNERGEGIEEEEKGQQQQQQRQQQPAEESMVEGGKEEGPSVKVEESAATRFFLIHTQVTEALEKLDDLLLALPPSLSPSLPPSSSAVELVGEVRSLLQAVALVREGGKGGGKERFENIRAPFPSHETFNSINLPPSLPPSLLPYACPLHRHQLPFPPYPLREIKCSTTARRKRGRLRKGQKARGKAG